jgi:hypothetical protein
METSTAALDGDGDIKQKRQRTEMMATKRAALNHCIFR